MKKDSKAKDDTFYQTYRHMQSWRENTLSDAFVEKMCLALMEWSELPDSLCLTQFLRFWGVPEKLFYRWLPKFPDLQDAHWYAMTNLGDRREIGAIKRQYDAGIIEKSLAVYSSAFAAGKAYDSKLRHEEQSDSYEDLTNCLTKLVEQKWGHNESDTGTTTQTPTVPTKTISEQDR